MGSHGAGVMLPHLAAIHRSADKNPIACSSARPIVGAAKLVKSDVTKNGVASGVIDQRNVARDAVHSGRSPFGDLPRLATVMGIRDARRHLPCDHSLLWILRIHGDGGFVEITGIGSYVHNMGLGSGRQLLRKDAAAADCQQQKWGSHKGFKSETHSK